MQCDCANNGTKTQTHTVKSLKILGSIFPALAVANKSINWLKCHDVLKMQEISNFTVCILSPEIYYDAMSAPIRKLNEYAQCRLPFSFMDKFTNCQRI